jgi:hypothetical protein
MTRMASRTRLPIHSLVVLLVVLGLGVAWLDQPKATEAAEAAPANLPAWTGGVNLYRSGTFTTQKSWLWCTAAGVQIVRNIVDRKTDHSTAGQRRYFNWMRGHNRYELPLSAGVDPAGWAAGLRHFVDDRYRLVSSRSFDSALRSAVKRLRLTNLPVALTVSHGNHGWILTGFRATADPAVTNSFRVTSVRVTGPLYGLQSKNGYDMAPNTKLTTAQLKRFFTPWKYAPKAMIWDGRYVSIQPVPKAAPAAAAVPTPSRAASASLSPAASPPPVPSSSPSPTASASVSLAPGAAAVASSDPGSGAGAATEAVASTGDVLLPLWILLGGVLAICLVALAAQRTRRRAT